MSEAEATPGTAVDGTPGQDPSGTPDQGIAPDNTDQNWADRYKEAQAWGTRLAQENAQLKSLKETLDDPDAFRQLMVERGWSVQDPEPDEYEDPSAKQLTELQSQLKELTEWRNSTTQQQQEAQQRQAYHESVSPKLAELGVPENLRELVAETAAQMPWIPTPQGDTPDLQGALTAIEEFFASGIDLPNVQKTVYGRLKETKRAPKVGNVGQAGEKSIPLDATHQQRVDAMMERLMADE